MESGSATTTPKETLSDRIDAFFDRLSGERWRGARVYRWVELLSAAVLALATVGTAWSGYQSARWSGDQTKHSQQASTAIVRSTHYANLAEQKLNLHVSLFGQWAAAVSTGNTPLADFLLGRFPEPLKAATIAWRATEPLTNPTAPATPFSMPDYRLEEHAEAERWEATATTESEAAIEANEHSEHYLLFTIIFAIVLFFAGISGKFKWLSLDIAMLALSVLVLVTGAVILVITPRT